MKQSVLIIGAGISGLAMAKALSSNADLQITVVDFKEPVFSFEGVGARVSAITPKSKAFFEKLNVWSEMEAIRVTPYQAMHVWDENSSGAIDFSARSINKAHLGFMVENRVMKKVLYDALQPLPNVEFVFGRELKSIARVEDVLFIETDQGDLKAHLLIGADGANSWVRNQAEFEFKEKAYGQSAIVTTVKTEKSHQFTAWQRFLKTGPLAFLPVVDAQTSSIVWSLDDNVIDEVFELSDDEFKKRCSAAFNYRLGNVVDVSKRFKFPLTMRHVQSYVKPNVALIADAAHTIHPLAGLGLNLGLQDVAVLSAETIKSLAAGKSVSDYPALRRYARAQKAENESVLCLMRSFKELFSNDRKTPALLRSLGLKLFNRSKLLKLQILSRFY